MGGGSSMSNVQARFGAELVVSMTFEAGVSERMDIRGYA
jgi:hypothetical protein